jgi:transposase
MHDVPDIHAIRVLHQRGTPKRQIAKMLRVSRKTVDKYTAADYVVPVRPALKLSQPRPAPKMDGHKATIEAWLKEDEQAPRKQRRTARKIYQDLVAQGADVSEVSVRQYVARVKGAANREAFVPLEFPLGAMAQADFGHAVVVLGGREQHLPFFASRLMASGVSFVKMYPHEKLEAFLDGVVSALSFVGGVPAQMMFDNASALVREVLGGGKRVQTPEFKALQAHYGFEAVFTNLGRGNEKAQAAYCTSLPGLDAAWRNRPWSAAAMWDGPSAQQGSAITSPWTSVA